MKKETFRDNMQFLTSNQINVSTYIDYLDRFKQVALSLFEWINLPKSMNADFLERTLYEYGKATLLKTTDYGFINTKCSSNGNINIYGLPSSFNCYSFDEFSENRTLYCGLTDTNEEYKSCILVKNNFDMIPTEPTLRLFAMRLYEAERTIDTNIKAQKTPVILIGDDTMKLTLQNLYLKYDGNQPVVFADKKQLGSDSIRALKSEAPYIADKVMEYKKQIWNEALTFLGINNISVEKKERLVTEEASSNNELINLNLQARLSCRKEACRQFNELFGLTGENAIDVRVRSDLHNVIKNLDSIVTDLEKENKEGGEENV